MTITMYQASVPVFSGVLKNLANVLAKGEKNAAERNIAPQTFLTARLAPDMLTLTHQVQIATDHAKIAPSRLAGKEWPRFEDNEASFADLYARIDKTRDFLKGVQASDIDGTEDRAIAFQAAKRELSFTGMQYLLHYAFPNFYFHVVTAYDILRHNGVPIGKGDFFGRG
jgi:uncharacterized protein